MNSNFRLLGQPSLITPAHRPSPRIGQQSQSSVSISSDLSSSCRFRIVNPLEGSYSTSLISHSESHKFEIPIVGYEVIEERAKFTVSI